MAEKLIPKNHGFGTRRVPLETRYYEVYNQPNVQLVDIKETPIERITPTGIKTSDAEYEFDIIIYATGLRRHHRQLRPHRHPGRGRAAAEGQVEGRAADLSRRPGRGLPQHVHADGAAHRAGQHPAQHRIQRRLGDRPDPPHARARPDAASRPRPRGGGGLDRPRQVAGRGPAVQRGQLLDDRHQHATSRASRPASSRATAAARRRTARGATRWRRRDIGNSRWHSVTSRSAWGGRGETGSDRAIGVAFGAAGRGHEASLRR